MSVSLIVAGAILLALPRLRPRNRNGHRVSVSAVDQVQRPADTSEVEPPGSPYEPSRARPYVQDRLPTTVMWFTGFGEDQTVPAMFLWLDKEEQWLAESSPPLELPDERP